MPPCLGGQSPLLLTSGKEDDDEMIDALRWLDKPGARNDEVPSLVVPYLQLELPWEHGGGLLAGEAEQMDLGISS